MKRRTNWSGFVFMKAFHLLQQLKRVFVENQGQNVHKVAVPCFVSRPACYSRIIDIGDGSGHAQTHENTLCGTVIVLIDSIKELFILAGKIYKLPTFFTPLQSRIELALVLTFTSHHIGDDAEFVFYQFIHRFLIKTERLAILIYQFYTFIVTLDRCVLVTHKIIVADLIEYILWKSYHAPGIMAWTWLFKAFFR